MFHTEHDLCPGDAALAEDTGGVEQDQGRQQAQDERAVLGIFPLDLACLRRQQVLQ
jgi:hypothetical protein